MHETGTTLDQRCVYNTKHLEATGSMKRQVKEACIKFGFPDLSSKVTVAVQEGDASVPRVRLGVVWRAMPKTEIPAFADAVSIYVSKGKSRIGDDVTPFIICIAAEIDTGTENGEIDGIALQRGVPLELYWQAAKLCPGEVHNGAPTAAYYMRRAKIYAKMNVKRRYIDKGLPIAGAVFGNDKTIFNYIDSRRFYCGAYAEAVLKTRAFKLLKELLNINVNVLLLGPDGHPMRMGESWEYAYADPSKQFGHERVLAVMLTKTKWPWESAEQ
jgi:hypothetical protein